MHSQASIRPYQLRKAIGVFFRARELQNVFAKNTPDGFLSGISLLNAYLNWYLKSETMFEYRCLCHPQECLLLSLSNFDKRNVFYVALKSVGIIQTHSQLMAAKVLLPNINSGV